MEIKILELERSINDKNVAPRNAPIPPGIARRSKIFLSMFSACQCDAPEAKVVPISAKCTAADATAADAPSVTNKVELVSPKPMPSEPSMSCAIVPTKAKRIQFIRES